MSPFSSLAEFCRHFFDEDACVQALFRSRWPDGYRCPGCGYEHYYLIRTRRLPLYQCISCGLQTSITAGTVMEKSRTPLTRWFQAFYLLSQPSGISSTALSESLGVTYKTAWHISHKIRHAMHHDEISQLLKGDVRVEEFNYGSALYADGNQPLLIGGSFDSAGKLSQIKIEQPHPDHVNYRTRYIYPAGTDAFIQNNVEPQAQTTRVKRFAKPHPALHPLKRQLNVWLNDTFFGIGAKHLQAYADEFCYRLNQKFRNLHPFESLLQQCANTPAIVYNELIRFRPVLPPAWLPFGSRSLWKSYHQIQWLN